MLRRSRARKQERATAAAETRSATLEQLEKLPKLRGKYRRAPKEKSSRPTWSSAEIGFRKMPKLWRTPRPMVRTRKPHFWKPPVIRPFTRLPDSTDCAGNNLARFAVPIFGIVRNTMVKTRFT